MYVLRRQQLQVDCCKSEEEICTKIPSSPALPLELLLPQNQSVIVFCNSEIWSSQKKSSQRQLWNLLHLLNHKEKSWQIGRASCHLWSSQIKAAALAAASHDNETQKKWEKSVSTLLHEDDSQPKSFAQGERERAVLELIEALAAAAMMMAMTMSFILLSSWGLWKSFGDEASSRFLTHSVFSCSISATNHPSSSHVSRKKTKENSSFTKHKWVFLASAGNCKTCEEDRESRCKRKRKRKSDGCCTPRCLTIPILQDPQPQLPHHRQDTQDFDYYYYYFFFFFFFCSWSHQSCWLQGNKEERRRRRSSEQQQEQEYKEEEEEEELIITAAARETCFLEKIFCGNGCCCCQCIIIIIIIINPSSQWGWGGRRQLQTHHYCSHQNPLPQVESARTCPRTSSSSSCSRVSSSPSHNNFLWGFLDFLSGCCRFINPNTEQISWTIFLLVQGGLIQKRERLIDYHSFCNNVSDRFVSWMIFSSCQEKKPNRNPRDIEELAFCIFLSWENVINERLLSFTWWAWLQ